MLAASPSPSPGTFRAGAFKNGSGSLSIYQSSPRTSAPPSQRSPRSVADIALYPSVPPLPPSPPLRANYQDASTQYSPMGEASQNSPLVATAKGKNTQAQNKTEAALLSGPSTATTSHDSIPCSSAPQAPPTRLQSPRTKRRQFKETTESTSSSATTQSSPPKRTKSAKTAAKVLPARYELCDVEDMVILIADMISELIETNDNLPLRDVVLTRFHSRFVHKCCNEGPLIHSQNTTGYFSH